MIKKETQSDAIQELFSTMFSEGDVSKKSSKFIQAMPGKQFWAGDGLKKPSQIS